MVNYYSIFLFYWNYYLHVINGMKTDPSYKIEKDKLNLYTPVEK